MPQIETWGIACRAPAKRSKRRCPSVKGPLPCCRRVCPWLPSCFDRCVSRDLSGVWRALIGGCNLSIIATASGGGNEIRNTSARHRSGSRRSGAPFSVEEDPGSKAIWKTWPQAVAPCDIVVSHVPSFVWRCRPVAGTCAAYSFHQRASWRMLYAFRCR